MLILGAYLLIDSVQATRHILPYFPYLLDRNNPPVLIGQIEIPATLVFTQAIHEALLGVGAELVALILVISGVGIVLVEGRAEQEERRHKELLVAISASKTPQ